jgi:hypothetical protein
MAAPYPVSRETKGLAAKTLIPILLAHFTSLTGPVGHNAVLKF